jgi:hypothetical protein
VNVFTNFAELLVRGLAVCGAAFVGFLLGWALAWLLNAAFFHLPRQNRRRKVLREVLRCAGGLAAAILAALLLFGSGGGLGFGGGPGEGKGEGPGQVPAGPTGPEPPDPAEATQPRVRETPPQSAGAVQVTLLAPPIRDQRYYRLEPERQPLTLEELQRAVLAKKQTPGPMPLKRLEVLVYNNSPNDRRLTRELLLWARRAELEVSVVPIDQDVP